MRVLTSALLLLSLSLAQIAASPTTSHVESAQLVERGFCTKSSNCNSGSFCKYGRCAKKAGDGKSCYKDIGCVNGLCYRSKCLAKSNRPNKSPCSSSTQCSSSNCSLSYCAAKVKNDVKCYKAANCLSGHCGSNKRCAAAAAIPSSSSTTSTLSATATGSTSSTTTTTATATASSSASTAATTAPVQNAGFASLQGYTITGNADVTIGNDPALARDGPYAQAVIPSGGSLLLTQTLPAPQRRRSLSLEKRVTPTYVTRIYRKTAAFAPPYQQADNGVVLTPVCRIYFVVNGVRSNFNTISAEMDWWQEGGYTEDAQLTSFGVEVVCEAGATTTMLFDDFSYIYIPGYVAPTTTTTATPTGAETASVDDGGSATVTARGYSL